VRTTFPEVVAVNALYMHGFVVIVSTRCRYGGFAKWVGMRVLSTPHCLGHATIVIVVDEDVDPFDLNQVMWAISVKVNPAYDTRCHPPVTLQTTGLLTLHSAFVVLFVWGGQISACQLPVHNGRLPVDGRSLGSATNHCLGRYADKLLQGRRS
jgi:3-octaprenyl-4-hydroxybenzoate carboxy-lyase